MQKANTKHGRYSLTHRKSLEEKAARFLADENPGDLIGELALLRALTQDFLDRFPEGVPLPIDSIQSLFSMVDAIGRKVERISKMLNDTALTQAEVQYLQARITDIFLKYVPGDKQNQCMGEIETAFVVRDSPQRAGSGAITDH